MQKCVKCNRVKEPSQLKTCALCRERGRQNHMSNREERNERRKLHHEANKEHDRERWQNYYAEKKDIINQQKRTDRANNPEKYKEPQHEKSQIHQKNLEESLRQNKTPPLSREHLEYIESLQPLDIIQ